MRYLPAFAPLAALSLAASGSATAAENVVPSCYAATGMGAAPRPTQELFVLVDQTTALDPVLNAAVRENAARLLRSGTAYTVASFSAFERSHYTAILSSGVLEAPIPAGLRPSVSVPRLKKLDACLVAQASFGARTALRALAQATAGSAGTFAHSEVMGSLKQLSARVAASPAPNRIVLVVSDMLEHSGVTSFYKSKSLRAIDPAAELANARASGMIGNFGGARVYVLGAGLLPPGGEGGRDPRAINALESFWLRYFAQSNARVAAFGTPDLVAPIR